MRKGRPKVAVDSDGGEATAIGIKACHQKSRAIPNLEKPVNWFRSVARSTLRSNSYFTSRTTKSGEGAAKPAVTAYSASPNAAIVVGTFVDGFEANGSVKNCTIAPDR